jgi:hypothetical protein
MATTAQFDANRVNAQASTGPVTPEGKARSARNAATFGLFSAHGFAFPGEEEMYARFREEYTASLAPDSALEHTLAAEITHAAWRLRRCVQMQANLDDWKLRTNPDPDTEEKYLRSVQRARASAERTFHRSIAELRRVQTERYYREESLPLDYDQSELGLAALQGVTPLIERDRRAHAPVSEDNVSESNNEAGISQITQQSQSAPTPAHRTPRPGRNAPCSCGSGLKYKRCCLRSQWRNAA